MTDLEPLPEPPETDPAGMGPNYLDPIPAGTTWGAAQPYVIAHLAHLQEQIEGLQAQIDALTDPPEEAP